MPQRKPTLPRKEQKQSESRPQTSVEKRAFNIPLVAETLLAWMVETQVRAGNEIVPGDDLKVARGAEPLAPVAADAQPNPESKPTSGVSGGMKRETEFAGIRGGAWLRSLTRSQFEQSLTGIRRYCYELSLPWTLREQIGLISALPYGDYERALAKELGKLTIGRIRAVWPDIEKVFRDWYEVAPRAIGAHGSITHGETVPVEQDDRIIVKQGTRYLPVSLAADIAQVPRTTLIDWIKAEKKFAGRLLQTYNSPTVHKLFLSEESVQRLANRFVKWVKEKPAGPAGAVKIAKTFARAQDQMAYIGLAKAAKAIGADYHTLWLWATQGKEAPANTSLDVIQDSASEQFYIRLKEVAELMPLIPKSGLRRGRRQRPPQL